MAVRELPRYEDQNPNYILVDNVNNFVNKLLKVDNLPDLLSTDTETYYNPALRAPQAISKWIKGSRNNCPFGASFFTGTQGYWVDTNLHELERLLLSPIPKTFHNCKYDLNMLKNIGLEVGGFIWDTMIMIQLIDEEFMCKLPPDENGVVKYKKSKALKNLGYHFNLMQDAHEYEDLVREYRRIIALNSGRGINDISYKEVGDANPILMKDYAVADTELGYHLHKILLPMLKEQELEPVYDIDFNATLAVIDIERNGYRLDVEQMNIDKQKLSQYIYDVDKRIYALCGGEFKINSDLELVEQFRKFGLEWGYYTDTDEFCTDKNVMKELMGNSDKRIANLAEFTLKHRQSSKILSTYIDGILQYIQEDGKVHPDFWVSPDDWDKGSTKTGRLSSSDPNFQNIKKKPVKFDEFDEMEDEDIGA